MFKISDDSTFKGLLVRMFEVSFGLNTEIIHGNRKNLNDLENDQLLVNSQFKEHPSPYDYANLLTKDFNAHSKPYTYYYLCEATIGQLKKLSEVIKDIDKENEFGFSLEPQLLNSDDETKLFYFVEVTSLNIYKPKEDLTGIIYNTYREFGTVLDLVFFNKEEARVFIEAKVLEEQY